MCYFCIWNGWMDGGIKGPSLNKRSPCLVWKPHLLGCLKRRRATFVDMSEQTVHLLLAEELKRQWIWNTGMGTANGCQSTQRAEGSVPWKAWAHKLLGTGGTQAVLGSSPSEVILSAEWTTCHESLALLLLGTLAPTLRGASNLTRCREASPFEGNVFRKKGASFTAHPH